MFVFITRWCYRDEVYRVQCCFFFFTLQYSSRVKRQKTEISVHFAECSCQEVRASFTRHYTSHSHTQTFYWLVMNEWSFNSSLLYTGKHVPRVYTCSRTLWWLISVHRAVILTWFYSLPFCQVSPGAKSLRARTPVYVVCIRLTTWYRNKTWSCAGDCNSGDVFLTPNYNINNHNNN